MRIGLVVLAIGILLAATPGCTPADPSDLAHSNTELNFHYMDPVGNCSFYLTATLEQMREMTDELDRICKPAVATCTDWTAKRAKVGLPATHPRRSAILEPSLHFHLSKAAASADSWRLDVPEKNELAAWMDNYCRVNPEHTTVQGAFRFVAEQKERERTESK
jgi:hypothetical protein